MCFALEEESALFTGDHVMGWSTTVVAPPDGDMGDYMRSLEKLIARADDILYPTHGSPIVRPRSFLRAYLSHRRMRENQIGRAPAARLRYRVRRWSNASMPVCRPRFIAPPP